MIVHVCITNSYYDEYVDCLAVAVKQFCGTEASTWQKTYVTELHQPAIDYIGCYSTYYGHSQ